MTIVCLYASGFNLEEVKNIWRIDFDAVYTMALEKLHDS